MKKVLSVLLILCLLVPVAALADQEVVNVFNWEDYIDREVLVMFEQETGIHVAYDIFTQNEDMIMKMENHPGAYDLVFPSEYMVERLLAAGKLAELNYDNIPNFKYMAENLVDPSYDPKNAHSVPYMWGTLGILYNTTKVDDVVDSWGILLDTKYKNEVIMMDSIRDAFGLALRYLGYDMNSTNFAELNEATQLLIKQKQSGVVKAYQMDETKDKMVAGEGSLAVMYSGDAQYSIELNPDLSYAVPKEGSNIWVDCMVIPADAKHKENAEKLINFLCRPDIAQLNCEAIGYSSPNTAAIEAMGEEYAENPVQNPDAEAVANCQYYHDLDSASQTIWNTLWQQVKNAK